MEKYTDTELYLAAQVGALRFACQQALALLQNGGAEASDASSVERLLQIVLEVNDHV